VLVEFAKLKKQRDLLKGTLRRHSPSAAPTRSVRPWRRKSSNAAARAQLAGLVLSSTHRSSNRSGGPGSAD